MKKDKVKKSLSQRREGFFCSQREPVFEIEFSTDDFSGEYDIKNDADKFRLYLDGKEIDFY